MFEVAPCESTPTSSACSAGLSVEKVDRVIGAVPSYVWISIMELLPGKYKPVGLVRSFCGWTKRLTRVRNVPSTVAAHSVRLPYWTAVGRWQSACPPDRRTPCAPTESARNVSGRAPLSRIQLPSPPHQPARRSPPATAHLPPSGSARLQDRRAWPKAPDR